MTPVDKPIVPQGFGSLSLSIPWFVSAHKKTGGTGLSLKPLVIYFQLGKNTSNIPSFSWQDWLCS